MGKELGKSSKSASTDKKYLKRSEVEAQRKAAYEAEQRALEQDREAKAAAKRKREEEAALDKAARDEKRRKLAEESRKRQEERDLEEERARRKRLGLPDLPDGAKDAVQDDIEVDDEDIPDEELLGKLRALGEPVKLFGETHKSRLRRYRRLTTVVTQGPIPTTLQLVEEKDMKVDEKVPKDKSGRKWLFRQLASYFTLVLTEYQKAMDAEKSDTTAGKQAYNAMVQTRENMKPVCIQQPAPCLSNFVLTGGALAVSQVGKG